MGDFTNSLNNEWFGTFRAKAGWAQNNWLFYATGGLAYGRFDTNGTFSAFPGITGISFAGSQSTTKTGWSLGGGLDYGITANWTVGVEYLYVDLGRVTFTEPGNGAGSFASSITASNRDAMNILRLTANYKF